MIALAGAFGSSDRRSSYQPIASASSVSDAIMRANVRVSALSSAAGSWYWSNPISPPSRLSPFSRRLVPGAVAAARARGDDLVPSRRDGVPERAEGIHGFAVGVAGLHVAA